MQENKLRCLSYLCERSIFCSVPHFPSVCRAAKTSETLEPDGCCRGSGPPRHLFALLLGRSDSSSLSALHNKTQTPHPPPPPPPLTIVALEGGEKRHQGLPLSFIHSFLSFSKRRINQLYTHTHTRTCAHAGAHACRRLTPFSLPSVYSAASDHLDLTCIVKKKNRAALPLSSPSPFSRSLFSFNCLSLMSRSSQCTDGGEEESEE